MELRRDVYQAIADPTRREIISLIARQSLNLNTIAASFEVSRPAISQHIRILEECGLVAIRKKGRERFCEARLAGLDQVTAWIEQHRVFWNAKIDALEAHLTSDKRKKKSPISKKRGSI